MKITIITACLNAHETLESCFASVVAQRNVEIEHILIDGGSTDGTLDVIDKYSDHIARVVSGPDNGIYDAMNKGLRLATGDVIGILNADDMYFNEYCLQTVVDEFERSQAASVFGDLVYIRPDNLDRVVRYYRSNHFSINHFARGWMPAHPTFFVKRACYERYGLFKTDYRIAADYELLVRFLAKHNVSYSYIPKVLVKMRTGGVSTRSLVSNYILNREIVRACRENGVETNIFIVLSKYFTKILQLFQKPQ
jgi:glycosyltransferase involved in cell wall biosynthesis